MVVLSADCLKERGSPAENYSGITLNSLSGVKRDCDEGHFSRKEQF